MSEQSPPSRLRREFVLMTALKLLLVLSVKLSAVSQLAASEPTACQRYWDEQNELPATETSTRIWGGDEVKPHGLPFLVLIDEKCAGAIIAPFQIITTADCVLDYFQPKSGVPPKPVDRMRVMKGEHNRTEADGEVRVAVAKVVAHEHYKDEGELGRVNNIALLETKEPLYTPDDLANKAGRARPIDIHCPPVADDQLLQVAGWGTTYPNDTELNHVPLSHQVKKVPQEMCRCFLAKYKLQLAAGSLCASFESGPGTICAGDSGDPLFRVTADGRWQLVGLASYHAVPCVHGKVPAVYTSLADHIKWVLESQTK